MAPLMRHGLLVATLAACGILMAWLVPPEPWTVGWMAPPTRYVGSEAADKARDLRSQVVRANETLKMYRLGEYVGQQMRSAIDAGERLTIELAPEYAEPTREAGLTSIAEQFETTSGGVPGVAFGLFMMDKVFGNHAELAQRLPATNPHHIFADLEADVPYCAVVVLYNPKGLTGHVRGETLRGVTADFPPETFSPFDQCGWLIQHGVPGPEIATWLRDNGAYDFAGKTLGEGRDDLSMVLEGSPLMVAYRTGRLNYLGDGAQGRICASGGIEGCRALLAMDETREIEAAGEPNPLVERRSVATWVYSGRNYRLSSFPFLPVHFNRLEEQFGTQAFQRFWRSPKPVAVAFEEAFDIEPGLWMMSWIQGAGGGLEAGPALNFEDIGLSILTIFSMLAIAIQVARNRTT